MTQAIVTIFIDTVLGWGTNVIAVKMLTRPYLPKGPIKLQGLIPGSIGRFADGVSKLIAEHLLTNEHILQILDEPTLEQAVKDHIIALVASYINNSQGDVIQESTVRSMVNDLFDNGCFKLPANLVSSTDIEKAISSRMVLEPRSMMPMR